MLHLSPAHHETSKHDSLNETKIKEKQNQTIPDSNSNLTKSMTQHNQTKELTTWFLNPEVIVDVSYAAPQAHRIVNVALHEEYSPGIIFIFF
jgi:hypothetical protein